MRRIITAADVELVALTGQRTLLVDEEDVVTHVALDMADKLGVAVVQGARPQRAAEPPAPLAYPAPATELPPRTPSRGPWIPAEFRNVAEPLEEATPHVAPSPTRPSARPSEELVLRNGTIVWPGQGLFQADMAIAHGKIASIHRPRDSDARRPIDVSGQYVLPGVIDPHVHLGIFNSFENDLGTETKAGLWGGLTALGCYRYEEGSYLPGLGALFESVERHSFMDLFFHLTLSTQQHLEEIPRYVSEYGVRSFKVYMSGVPGVIPHVDDAFLTKVYEKLLATEKPCTVCIHAENPSLVQWATAQIQAQDGQRTSIQEWSETHPPIAEEEAIRRACFLTREIGGVSTYFVHVSSKGGIEALAELKCARERLYAETTSPYLLFSIEKVTGNIPKWLPPIRDARSLEALWECLRRGKVDTLGTDSVPMSSEIKGLDKTVWEAMPNAPVMEHHLPGILTEGVVRRGLPLATLTDLMTRRPAEIFGIYPEKGSLLPGTDADIVVVDLDRWERVGKDHIRSASSFSLFEGKELTGWPTTVIKGGKVIIDNGEWVADPPPCRVLNRRDSGAA